jgi:hypothetical protein
MATLRVGEILQGDYRQKNNRSSKKIEPRRRRELAKLTVTLPGINQDEGADHG